MGKLMSKSKSSFLHFDSVIDSDNEGNMQTKDCFPINSLPEDALFEVLLRVPGLDLVRSCVRVCRRWRDIIDTQAMWKSKCLYEHRYSLQVLHHLVVQDVDFKSIFIKKPYMYNLIKNHDSSKGLTHWEILKNGGNQWGTEESPVGSHPLSQFKQLDNPEMSVPCWVTSYGVCSKVQVIDLLKAGCSAHVLDHLRPDIKVSEWYAARFDCGSEYTIKVSLLRQKGDRDPIDEWKFHDIKPAGRDWFSSGHTFSNYKPGVRFIRFKHSGKDTQFWAGWFGPKITHSTVIIDVSKTRDDENKLISEKKADVT